MEKVEVSVQLKYCLTPAMINTSIIEMYYSVKFPWFGSQCYFCSIPYEPIYFSIIAKFKFPRMELHRTELICKGATHKH